MRLPEPKPLKTITFLLILLFYGLLLTYKINLPAADDMARHIKNGELIMRGHFEVLYSNVYSYTMPDQPFINHHWLSGVIFYLIYTLTGWSGLVIFKVIILLTAFSLLFRTALIKANFWLVAFFSIFTIFILQERSALRPEIFSYLFITIFLYSLTNTEKFNHKKRLFWLVLLQLLWVNMHIFFIVGPALVAGFLFEKVFHRFAKRKKNNKEELTDNNEIKQLAFLLLALIVVSFFNPNGIRGALYPLHIFNNYGIQVVENNPLFDYLRNGIPEDNFSKIVFCISVSILGISFFLNIKKKSIFYFFAAIVSATAGFMVVRFISFFGLIFLPAITFNLDYFFLKIKTALEKTISFSQNLKRLAMIVFIMMVLSAIFLKSEDIILNKNASGIGLTARAEDATTFFEENNLKGPIFNDYDIGSYLIYKLFPREKVFIDNRPEAYSSSFCLNTYLPIFVNETVWEKTLENYKFNTIYLYQYSIGAGIRDFMYRRVKDTSWALVYADRYSVIFIKNDELNKNIIQKNQITTSNVAERVSYLKFSNDFDDEVAAADIFNLVGRFDLAEELLFRIVSKWPQKGKIWNVLGQIELQNTGSSKSPLLSILCFNTAISSGYKTAEVYTFLGTAYLKVGFTDHAIDAFQTALRINPEFADAKYQLELIEREKSSGK